MVCLKVSFPCYLKFLGNGFILYYRSYHIFILPQDACVKTAVKNKKRHFIIMFGGCVKEARKFWKQIHALIQKINIQLRPEVFLGKLMDK